MDSTGPSGLPFCSACTIALASSRTWSVGTRLASLSSALRRVSPRSSSCRTRKSSSTIGSAESGAEPTMRRSDPGKSSPALMHIAASSRIPGSERLTLRALSLPTACTLSQGRKAPMLEAIGTKTKGHPNQVRIAALIAAREIAEKMLRAKSSSSESPRYSPARVRASRTVPRTGPRGTGWNHAPTNRAAGSTDAKGPTAFKALARFMPLMPSVGRSSIGTRAI